MRIVQIVLHQPFVFVLISIFVINTKMDKFFVFVKDSIFFCTLQLHATLPKISRLHYLDTYRQRDVMKTAKCKSTNPDQMVRS